ncbi:MAG: serine hydroxymethyltransferase [Hyphomonadaceae bacterium]
MPQTAAASAEHDRFFSAPLEAADPELFEAMRAEKHRQATQIELIASENIVSRAVLEAQGSVLTNKYAEGYPGRRYYGGCEFVDVVETLAIERAKRLFNCGFANVQPHSGSSANQAAFLALLQPGDKFLGMDLACGGHLTHGSPVNMSGKWFKVVPYGVRRDDHLIDYDELAALAEREKPKLILAGATAYPRQIDFKRMREIADSVGAYLMADIAHYAGLVAAGLYPSPLPYAHVVTTTTHKTLRGPRGAMLLTNDEEIGKKLNSAVFPGMQGGPLMHVVAAKAVALKEALEPEFKLYARRVIENSKALAERLGEHGLAIVSGGTDCHLSLVDLRAKNVTGKAAEKTLEHAGITANKNAVPYDTAKPAITSGLRVGSPAATTRGFGPAEFRQVADLMVEVLEAYARSNGDNSATEQAVAKKVEALTARFPIYPQ